MKIYNVKNETQRQLKTISDAGSVAAKTKIAVESDEKFAKESNAQLSRPSKYLQKFASAMKRLNTF